MRVGDGHFFWQSKRMSSERVFPSDQPGPDGVNLERLAQHVLSSRYRPFQDWRELIRRNNGVCRRKYRINNHEFPTAEGRSKGHVHITDSQISLSFFSFL